MGSQHAPDSCLLRAAYDGRFELHACDFPPPERYRLFHDFAEVSYRQLVDTVEVPYASSSFDVVVASGVLEHVAMDYESLKELYRILKVDGVLIISYLPNFLSYKEWIRRSIQRQGFHRRLYGIRETKQLLKRSGFYPEFGSYHSFFFDRLLARAGIRPSQQISTALAAAGSPLCTFSSTLFFIAKKVACM